MKQDENSEQQFSNGQEHVAPPPEGEVDATGVRPIPELPRIFADNNDKKRMVFHWAIFVGIIILAMGLGSVVPEALEHRANNNPECMNPVGFDSANRVICSPFHTTQQLIAGTLITGLRDFNQFLLGRIVFQLKQPTSVSFNYQSEVKVNFYSVKKDKDGKYIKDMEYKRDSPTNLTVNAKEADSIFQSGDSKVLVALDISFLYLHEIDKENYMFTVVLPSNSSGQLTQVSGVVLYATVISFGYTQFGVALRFVFFFLTLGSTIYYIIRLRKIKRSEHIIEQRLIIGLSIITIIFNDPFYILTVTHPNVASNVFSVMFVVTLATFLVVFWLVILDVKYFSIQRINNQNSQVQSNAFTWKKGLYLSVLWLSCFFYYMFYSFAFFTVSPLTTTTSFNRGGMVYLMMWIIVLFVGGLGFMIAQYVQIFMKFESKLWRHQLFVFFSIFFVLVTFFFFFINGFDIHSFVGGRVLMLYVEINTYMFYMQYMYSPTDEAINKSESGEGFHTAQQLQQNTNIDELRSVQINFPEDNYNQMHEDGGSQDFELGEHKKRPVAHPVHQNNEEVIQFE